MALLVMHLIIEVGYLIAMVKCMAVVLAPIVMIALLLIAVVVIVIAVIAFIVLLIVCFFILVFIARFTMMSLSLRQSFFDSSVVSLHFYLILIN